MKIRTILVGLFIIVMLGLSSVSCSRNVDWVKARAEARWKELGYTSPVYEGYQWSLMGGDVWYQVKRPDTPGVVYTGFLRRWDDELHLYSLTVVSGNQFNITGAK